jgi:hypothetical protein
MPYTSNPIDQLAAAVVGRLNARALADGFVVRFTARKVNEVSIAQVDDTLDVVVVGSAMAAEGIAGDTDIERFTIEVGVLQKLKSKATKIADADRLKLLVYQISRFLRSSAGRLDEAPEGAGWTPVEGAERDTVEIKPLYDEARLRRLSRFISVQRHVYKVPTDVEGDDA